MAKYYSKYTSPPKQIRVDQYIAEAVCYYNAKKDGADLPLYFWKLDNWSKFYFIQVRHAIRLLDQYPPEYILNFIRKNRIYSLGASWIKQKLESGFSDYKPIDIIEVDTDKPVTYKKNKDIDIGFLDG